MFQVFLLFSFVNYNILFILYVHSFSKEPADCRAVITTLKLIKFGRIYQWPKTYLGNAYWLFDINYSLDFIWSGSTQQSF